MEQIAAYLEALGYQVEEQGKIKRFLTILKDGLPVGFILPDFSVRTMDSQDDKLAEIVRFVQENQNLPIAGAGRQEYIIANFRASKLTTFYDTDLLKPRYNLYIEKEDGSIATPPPYDSYHAAMAEFLTATGITTELQTPKESFMTRWRRRRIAQLQRKL